MRWQVSCYLNHGIGSFFFFFFPALQKRWNQDSQQHNESFRAKSEPKGTGPSHPVPWPSVRLQLQAKQGPNTCPVWPTKHPTLHQARYRVSQMPHRRHYCLFLGPLFHLILHLSPPLCAHNIKIGWLDSRCLCLKKNLQTLLMNQLKKNICTNTSPISFFICLQEYCDLLYNDDVEESCKTLWFSVPQRGWAVFYTASSFSWKQKLAGNLIMPSAPPELYGRLSFFAPTAIGW